jgi:hypothetical protein
MVLPTPFQPFNYNNLHYYQGVLIAEVAVTLFIFFILKVIHYIKWGYDDEAGHAANDDKPPSVKEG